MDAGCEVLVGPLAAGEPDESESGRQQAAVREVVHRRHELLPREITRDAEHHEHAGTGDAGKPTILWIAQRIPAEPLVDHRCPLVSLPSPTS
jgi:hypothetical protein